MIVVEIIIAQIIVQTTRYTVAGQLTSQCLMSV